MYQYLSLIYFANGKISWSIFNLMYFNENASIIHLTSIWVMNILFINQYLTNYNCAITKYDFFSIIYCKRKHDISVSQSSRLLLKTCTQTSAIIQSQHKRLHTYMHTIWDHVFLCAYKIHGAP